MLDVISNDSNRLPINEGRNGQNAEAQFLILKDKECSSICHLKQINQAVGVRSRFLFVTVCFELTLFRFSSNTATHTFDNF